MAFDQTTRTRLQKFVSASREILTEEFTRQLQAIYGLDPKNGTAAPVDTLNFLDNKGRQTAVILRQTLAHYVAAIPGKSEKARTQQALDRIIREQAFTVLNRLAALRMAEARGFLIESVARGYSSKGFQLYKTIAGTGLGETGDAYSAYLFSIFDEFSLDLSALFDRHSIQGRLFPRESALLALLDQINHFEIEHLWVEDETIGWIYQYFNTQEERKKMRAESQAPRNSRELAVRNQFFTPRYVVEFLTDNTLGRIWYEMTQGNTALVDTCHYLVRRPTEIFLAKGEASPEEESEDQESLSQEELLKQPVYIPFRQLKDPRELRMLDPACGSMHFGLYAFDLFEKIYEEAWQIETDLGPSVFERSKELLSLQASYASVEEFQKAIPKLIIENNIHGVDIDPRAVQIAGLSLWQRAQRAWHQMGIKPNQRPTIKRSNIVCAEPMPGEKEMLLEFTSRLNPPMLGQLVETIFDKMELAGEAGTLLKIEEEIKTAISRAKEAFNIEILRRKEEEGYLPGMAPKREPSLFDFADLYGDTDFWETAEERILDALRDYADQAESDEGQKRLFAEDAAKGFAFIDLCRKRFDVVLMNPPFGDVSGSSEKYLNKNYINHCNNIISSFITRTGIMLCPKGMSAAIFDKTISIKSSYSKIRNEYLFGKHSLIISSDLGWGVLDQAQVETVVCVFSNDRYFEAVENVIINSDYNQSIIANTFSLKNIEKIPNLALSLDLPVNILNIFSSYGSFEPTCSVARQGLGISDSWRWYRTKSETPLGKIGEGSDFSWLANGGGLSSFFRDSDLTIYWKDNGYAIKQTEADIYGVSSRTVKNIDFYFQKGLSFPKRTEILNAHALPSGHIFTVEGLGCFPKNDKDMWHTLALLNSKLLGYLINTFCGQHKHVGYVKQLPFSEGNASCLTELSKKIFILKRAISQFFSNTALFIGPASLYIEEFAKMVGVDDICSINNLSERIDMAVAILNKSEKMFDRSVDEINELVFSAYNIDEQTIDYICDNISNVSHSILHGIIKTGNAKEQLWSDIIEYIIGLSFGHYLICKVKVNNDDPFVDAPPSLSPAINTNNEYGVDVIEISRNIKCEKFSNTFRLIEDELRIDSEDIESSLLSYYDSPDMSEIFLNNLIFFDSHLSTYSKSRRLAPIYWPLQTPSCSYALWIYYHRLTDQTLYTCVNDFVEPKLKNIIDDLNTLRNKSSRSSAEEKELANLSDLETELKNFRDELVRIAKFWKPNLNDGVQITAAPLWKLFQHRQWQNKLKETWEKLEHGEYDWAHLACSIWPERVLGKCHEDRSLAIAHEVEEDFWEEIEVAVIRRGKDTGKTKTEWHPRPFTQIQLNELIQQKINAMKPSH